MKGLEVLLVEWGAGRGQGRCGWQTVEVVMESEEEEGGRVGPGGGGGGT